MPLKWSLMLQAPEPSEVTSHPLGDVFLARQRLLLIFQKSSEHVSPTERAGHSTGPKGSAEPEISKFLSALTELLLSQVSGSSKSGCCPQTDLSGLRMQAFFLIKVKA